MPIKIRNMNTGIIKDNIPVKAVMIGSKCVYGFDFAAFKILYPSITNGTGLYIDVNGSRKMSNPTTAGELDVHDGDRIIVRTYAEIGYKNPGSAVIASGNMINGTDYALNMDGISIMRSTTYEFISKGDCLVTLAETVPAPKVNISIIKDAGIDNVSIYCFKSPYEYSGLNNYPLETVASLFTATDETIQMYIYSKITTQEPFSVAEEGYKVVSTTKNYSGLLTANNQCTVSAVSQAGTRVSIICPPIPNGVTTYDIYMVSSEYSRNISDSTNFYSQTLSLPSLTSVELLQRHNNTYYFYKGDTIKIFAARKDGYKYPTLGKDGDITALVTNKKLVLSDNNVLVVREGEQGTLVQLVNNSLGTTERAFLSVSSDYVNYTLKDRFPQIYVGDKITVPLSPDYRIGTSRHRKPGVGFSAGGNILLAPTFTAAATLNVPNVSVLTVNLQQGAERISTGQFSLSSVATFSRLTNISPMNISYSPIYNATVTPVAGYGPEEYFLSSFDMTYSCKRYWLDAVTSKYNKITQLNVPNNFSYKYDCDIWPTKEVIAGTYTINSDKKGVKVTVSNYDTDWVANSSDEANLIPRLIIV